MANWQTALTGRLGRKTLGAALPVVDLRRQYEDIFAGYGTA